MQHVYEVGYTVVYRSKHGRAWRRLSFDAKINVVANGNAAKAVSKAKRIVLAQKGWKDDSGHAFKPLTFAMTSVTQGCEINVPGE